MLHYFQVLIIPAAFYILLHFHFGSDQKVSVAKTNAIHLLLFCVLLSKGQSLESLDYDTVQDVSLLLGPGGWGSGLRRLGCSLGVPSEILTHLHSFQDLFQYLRTSTYTLLPQLAQAAALMPHPDIVSRIHRALVAKCMEATQGCCHDTDL